MSIPAKRLAEKNVSKMVYFMLSGTQACELLLMSGNAYTHSCYYLTGDVC